MMINEAGKIFGIKKKTKIQIREFQDSKSIYIIILINSKRKKKEKKKKSVKTLHTYEN